MAERLNAYLAGERVGTFTRDTGKVVFDYADSWNDAVTFSASMPVSLRHHDGREPINYLNNLLPDDPDTVDRWVRTMPDARAGNPLSILSYVGLDTAGGAQFATGDLPGPRESGIDPITESDIAKHIEALQKDKTSWLLQSEHNGKISLAGAQAKFALRRTARGWGVPYGDEPTTHIIKPGRAGLRDLDIVEHLSQATAERVGIDAAHTEVMRFGGQTAIVVSRYDRRIEGDTVTRVHQEDFCQASGTAPDLKYQNDGGPGILQVADIIKDLVPGKLGLEEAQRFLQANAYNWLIAGTDAHAKNYSLLHSQHGTRLAPFYDIASILPYVDNMHHVKLAMKVDSKYEMIDVSTRHWERVAGGLGLDPASFVDWIRETNRKIPDAAADASHAMTRLGIRDSTGLVDKFAERSAEVEVVLSRPPSLTR